MKMEAYVDVNGKCEYLQWVNKLDTVTSRRIKRHVDRLKLGLGDIKHISGSLFELRMDFGPGYRVYFVRKGNEVIILLGGSAKIDQERAIERSKRIAAIL